MNRYEIVKISTDDKRFMPMGNVTGKDEYKICRRNLESGILETASIIRQMEKLIKEYKSMSDEELINTLEWR